jgi:hypothetical protein
MKTTIEIDDRLLRRAKSHAAARGMTLRQFVSEAIEGRLESVTRRKGRPAWMDRFGELASLHAETARIERRIAEEFEQVDAEDDA